MKTILTAAIAATLALGSVGAANAAPQRGQAHPPQSHQQQQRHDARDAHGGGYERWQSSQRRYSAGRYTPPRGYQTRSWGYGQRIPANYRSSQYVVRDYGRYGLRRPPAGYEYVRSGNDVVLAAVATGLITAVIAGLFN